MYLAKAATEILETFSPRTGGKNYRQKFQKRGGRISRLTNRTAWYQKRLFPYSTPRSLRFLTALYSAVQYREESRVQYPSPSLILVLSFSRPFRVQTTPDSRPAASTRAVATWESALEQTWAPEDTTFKHSNVKIFKVVAVATNMHY